MNNYTPDTSSVIYAFVDGNNPRDEEEHLRLVGEFQDWLNEERAKVWDLARSEVRSIPSWYNAETEKGGFDLQPLGPDASSEEGGWDAVMEILNQNPYRKADQ